MQARFKDEETFLKYDPSGEQAKEIYNELELARCELLGENITLIQEKHLAKTKVEASNTQQKRHRR